MKKIGGGDDKCATCGHKRYRHQVQRVEGNQVCMNMVCPCPNWVEPKNVFEKIREAGEAGLRAGASMTDETTVEGKALCTFCSHIDVYHDLGIGEGNRNCHATNCQCPDFIAPEGYIWKNEYTPLGKPIPNEDMVGARIVSTSVNDEEGITITAVREQVLDGLSISAKKDSEYSLDEIAEKVTKTEWSQNQARAAVNSQALLGENISDGMSTEQFNTIVEAQIARSSDMLIKKAKEYATDGDRMHNFKVAAKLQGGTPEQALGGFLAKHTVSIFDMINSGDEYPLDVWNEKITDHINYLLILRALVEDK